MHLLLVLLAAAGSTAEDDADYPCNGDIARVCDSPAVLYRGTQDAIQSCLSRAAGLTDRCAEATAARARLDAACAVDRREHCRERDSRAATLSCYEDLVRRRSKGHLGRKCGTALHTAKRVLGYDFKAAGSGAAYTRAVSGRWPTITTKSAKGVVVVKSVRTGTAGGLEGVDDPLDHMLRDFVAHESPDSGGGIAGGILDYVAPASVVGLTTQNWDKGLGSQEPGLDAVRTTESLAQLTRKAHIHQEPGMAAVPVRRSSRGRGVWTNSLGRRRLRGAGDHAAGPRPRAVAGAAFLALGLAAIGWGTRRAKELGEGGLWRRRIGAGQSEGAGNVEGS